MLTQSSSKILEHFRSEGLATSKFSLVTKGDYSVAEAEWNYKDALHHNFVHRNEVKQMNTMVDDDKYSAIWHMNLFGLKVPICVLNLQPDPQRQVSITPIPGFILVIENHWEALKEGAQVTTTYNICSSKFLAWAHGIIRWMLTRNYKKFMKDDKPLRERRAELRRWGYSFTNESNSHYSYKHAYAIANDFVEPPQINTPATRKILLAELPEGSSFLGRSDHWGVRFERTENHLRVYPRLCPHAGASLDDVSCEKQTLQCPWHGRRLSELGSFDLQLTEEQSIQTPYMDLRFFRQQIEIHTRSPERIDSEFREPNFKAPGGMTPKKSPSDESTRPVRP